MNSSLLILAGVGLGFASLGVLLWAFVGTGDRSRQRLANLGAGDSGAAEVASPIPGIRGDMVPLITQLMQNTQWWQELQIQLIRGGWLLRPSEFIAVSLGAAGLGSGIGFLVTHALGMGIGIGCFVGCIPYVLLKGRQTRRVKMLGVQLPDALDMLSGSLRSGFSVLRAMQVVRSQMHPPIAEEFGRVVDEVQYGIPIEQALDNLVARTGSYDLELIVAAIQTQLSVGGNLAEIFESIGTMIRERVRLYGELQAATAEGRMSAGILLAMPFAMALIVNLMSPGYMAPLFREPLGLILIGVAGGLMLVGTLIISKLINIDI